MRRIIQIVDQIEHAKSLIADGTNSKLRMALLLLDNAIEIMMFRTIKEALQRSALYERMFQKFSDCPKDKEGKKLYFRIKKKILSESDQKRISKYFDEKIKFISGQQAKVFFGRKKLIHPDVANVLSAIHKYRNEIYHRDHVRKETLRHSVLILLNIACELFVKLPHSGALSIRGGEVEEIKKFRERMGLDADVFLFLKQNEYKKITKKLKVRLSVKDLSLGLEKHLMERINSTFEGIEFIRRDGLNVDSNEEALRRILFFTENFNNLPFEDIEEKIIQYKPKWDMSFFDKLKQSTQRLGKQTNKIKAFRIFSEIERELEPLEIIIDAAAMQLDMEIQHAIDAARGK